MYEELCSLIQGDKTLEDYYKHFKGMIDELNLYHQVTNDIEVLKKREEMFVSFFRASVLNSNHFEDIQMKGNFISTEYFLIIISAFKTSTAFSGPSPIEGSTLVGSISRDIFLEAMVVCFFMVVIYLLEVEFFVVVMIILKNVLIVIKLITLLTDIGSCMIDLHGLLMLLIYVILLDHILHITQILLIFLLTNM